MNFYKRKKLFDKAEKKADQVLKDNYVIEAPVKVQDIARSYGLLVEEVDLGDFGANVSGFLEPTRKVIYLNKKDSTVKKAFTIAHELAHWLMHSDDLDQVTVYYRTPLGAPTQDEKEKEANAFAARLLVPKRMLAEYKVEEVSTIAKIFGVSEDLVGYRLKHEFGRQ